MKQNETKSHFPHANASLYLLGLFISSFGSLTYAATLPILLFRGGVSTIFIGLLIGSMRINTFFVNLLLGHIGDRISPRKVMIICECGAALASVLILFCWKEFGTGALTPFLLANNLRVFFTSLQAGSVQKFGKLFDEEANWGGAMAVWLNGATNGAMLFAGLLSLAFFKHLSVETVVLVDLVSFIINGIMLYMFQKSRAIVPASPGPAPRLELNISSYARRFPQLMFLDTVLSLALCGSNTLNVRLLGYEPSLVPLLPALFGGAAFLTAFSSRFRIIPNNRIIWLIYAFSILLQGIFADHPYFVLCLSVARNLAYWMIFQAISRELMVRTPSASYARVSAGRNSLSIGILASGEFWVGATAGISIKIEMLWRSVVALLPGFKKIKL